MQAMILAAGFGTRLRPHSLVRPKPLFPVLGHPLVLRIVDQLRAAGCEPVVVNGHYRAKQLAASLAHSNVIFQHEEQILGTGGGLALAARRHLAPGPVLVTNADIFHEIDYRAVIRAHLASGCEISMVMRDEPRFNTVWVDTEHCRVASLPGMAADRGQKMAFSGIHVVSTSVLLAMPPDRESSIIDCYAAHLAGGGEINAILMPRAPWRDIGTPADYLTLHRELLAAGGHDLEKRGHQRLAPGCYAAAGSRIGPEVTWGRWCYIGANAEIGAGAHLDGVVVWDGARVTPGARLVEQIVTGA